MQQPVNNRWLSPALRNLAADQGAWTPDRQRDLYHAGLEAREAIVLQTRAARRVRSKLDRPRVYASEPFPARPAGGATVLRQPPTGAGTLRQILLAVAMAGLLLGSIAFSLLAWSGTLTPSPTGLADTLLAEAPVPVHARGGNTTGARQPPASPDADGARETDMSPGQRVRLLRQENGRLHERASALRSQLR
jgi:hypothetical protein